LFLRADEPNKALACIKYLPQAQQGQATNILMQIINDKAILAKQPHDPQATARLVTNYKLLGLTDLAAKISSK